MERNEYQVMFNVEDDYWWYVGLRRLVFSSIHKFSHKKDGLRILDAGCGTGRILQECKNQNAYGLDFSEDAIRFCKLRNINNLIIGSICDLPFKENLFDILISLDVIPNVGTENDLKALKELHKAMKEDGILIINLVAFDCLQSKHDKAVHVKHRYTVKELKWKVEKAGFLVEKITYRNTFLFPATVIKRIADKLFSFNKQHVESDLKPLPGWLNTFFAGLLSLENRLLISGFNFPFGLSVYCIARKRDLR